MKIQEMVERECCSLEKGDLLTFKGTEISRTDTVTVFCKHCGQLWVKIGPIGSTVKRIKRVVVNYSTSTVSLTE